MAKIYYDKDANLRVLKGKTIAVIGYGAQGHAQAQNLRDSGLKVIVAEVPGTDNYKLAKKHGFRPVSAAEAATEADFIQVLVPDEIQPDVYRSEIAPGLKPGKTIGFSHGFNIHFRQIIPPPDIDVVMVAPKGPGRILRSEFEKGSGVPCLVAIQQGASRKAKAKAKALAYAKALGGTRAGVIETTFAEETETDLFGEQVVLCGGVSELVKKGFETLVEAGYQPEIAYFECMHELKLIVDLFYQGGLTLMRNSVSNTAKFGDFTRGSRIITEQTKREMKKILLEVQSGQFAREWILENQAGLPFFRAMKARDENHLIEKVGKKLRSMMPWISGK